MSTWCLMALNLQLKVSVEAPADHQNHVTSPQTSGGTWRKFSEKLLAALTPWLHAVTPNRATWPRDLSTNGPQASTWEQLEPLEDDFNMCSTFFFIVVALSELGEKEFNRSLPAWSVFALFVSFVVRVLQTFIFSPTVSRDLPLNDEDWRRHSFFPSECQETSGAF